MKKVKIIASMAIILAMMSTQASAIVALPVGPIAKAAPVVAQGVLTAAQITAQTLAAAQAAALAGAQRLVGIQQAPAQAPLPQKEIAPALMPGCQLGFIGTIDEQRPFISGSYIINFSFGIIARGTIIRFTNSRASEAAAFTNARAQIADIQKQFPQCTLTDVTINNMRQATIAEEQGHWVP